MALSLEANRALRDGLIRSAFRLVDVDVRVNSTVERMRVSSLLSSLLAGEEAQESIIADPPFIPGVPPPIGPPPGTEFPPGDVVDGVVPPIDDEEDVGELLAGIPNFDTYAVSIQSGSTSRTGPILRDGVVVRVTGSVAFDDVIGINDGVAFFVSTAPTSDTSVFDPTTDTFLFTAAFRSGNRDANIAAQIVDTLAGYVPPFSFDFRLSQLVRRGETLCIGQVSPQVSGFAIFEVQIGGVTSRVVIQKGLESSHRHRINVGPINVRIPPHGQPRPVVNPPLRRFTPVMMTRKVGPVSINRLASTEGLFRRWFEAGFRPIGNLGADGVSLI